MKKINTFFVVFMSLLSFSSPLIIAADTSKTTPTETVLQNIDDAITLAAQQIVEQIITKNNISLTIANKPQDPINTLTVEQKKTYLSRFIATCRYCAKNLITHIKGNYYSETDKALAKSIVIQLQQLATQETDPSVLKILNSEIYQYQLISGDKMSIKRKLFFGAVTMVLIRELLIRFLARALITKYEEHVSTYKEMISLYEKQILDYKKLVSMYKETFTSLQNTINELKSISKTQ